MGKAYEGLMALSATVTVSAVVDAAGKIARGVASCYRRCVCCGFGRSVAL